MKVVSILKNLAFVSLIRCSVLLVDERGLELTFGSNLAMSLRM